jgi:hypothetical protein
MARDAETLQREGAQAAQRLGLLLIEVARASQGSYVLLRRAPRRRTGELEWRVSVRARPPAGHPLPPGTTAVDHSFADLDLVGVFERAVAGLKWRRAAG